MTSVKPDIGSTWRTQQLCLMLQILPMTDILGGHQEDLDFIVPKTLDAISAFLKMSVSVALVTDGPNGIAVHTKDDPFRPPVEVEAVVDSIGAGDIFAGEFLS